MAGVLVHEWLEPIGGSENVLEELANLFPDAPIYCLWNDAPERFSPDRVRESWLARTPLRRHKAIALLFMPFVWRRLKADSQPDWVLSSSHLFAHHAFFPQWRDVKRFSYVHSPARYIWSPELDERGRGFITRFVAWVLKPLDQKRARELNAIAANSSTVAERVTKYWGREATVIHPPVDVSRFQGAESLDFLPNEREVIEALPTEFVLGVSRFVPYKRLDVTVAYGEANHLPVVLAGGGPDSRSWEDLAQRSERGQITIIDKPRDKVLGELIRRAKVLVFAAIEDFGIIPVEALAMGTPVVGNRRGGVAETVVPGKSGALLENFTRAEMAEAHEEIEKINPQDCRARAAEFTPEKFRYRISTWLNNGVFTDERHE